MPVPWKENVSVDLERWVMPDAVRAHLKNIIVVIFDLSSEFFSPLTSIRVGVSVTTISPFHCFQGLAVCF